MIPTLVLRFGPTFGPTFGPAAVISGPTSGPWIGALGVGLRRSYFVFHAGPAAIILGPTFGPSFRPNLRPTFAWSK